MSRTRLLTVGIGLTLYASQMAFAQPANDHCADATQQGSLVVGRFNTTLATQDGPDACAGINGRDIWYWYTPLCSGYATISLCGSDFDTVIAVYEDTPCPAELGRLIACNDDADACSPQSEVTIPVRPGTTYRVQVGGFGGAAGAGRISIEYFLPCAEDIDRDGTVGLSDLAEVLSGIFRCNGAVPCCPAGGDLDADDDVDLEDLVRVLAAFGTTCP